MALLDHLEQKDVLDSTDIRVCPVTLVVMGLLEQLDSEVQRERPECGRRSTHRQQPNQTALARPVRQVEPVRQDTLARQVHKDPQGAQDHQDLQERLERLD